MMKRNIIIEEKAEHFTQYYCKPLEPEDKKVLSVLRQKKSRSIVMIILVNKKAKYGFIVQTLKLSPPAISFYLKYLLNKHIIERTKIGYENIYTLKDQDRIEKILITYQSSFFDTLVDDWASAWIENRFDKDELNEENPE
jgi:predicted transcriptional regulator